MLHFKSNKEGMVFVPEQIIFNSEERDGKFYRMGSDMEVEGKQYSSYLSHLSFTTKEEEYLTSLGKTFGITYLNKQDLKDHTPHY